MNMIERIATCITGGSVFSVEDRVEIARNILNEMRKPSDAMIVEGEYLLIDTDAPLHVSGSIFSVMIDAALKESNELA